MKPESSSQYTLKSHSIKANTYSGIFLNTLGKLDLSGCLLRLSRTAQHAEALQQSREQRRAPPGASVTSKNRPSERSATRGGASVCAGGAEAFENLLELGRAIKQPIQSTPAETGFPTFGMKWKRYTHT